MEEGDGNPSMPVEGSREGGFILNTSSTCSQKNRPRNQRRGCEERRKLQAAGVSTCKDNQEFGVISPIHRSPRKVNGEVEVLKKGEAIDHKLSEKHDGFNLESERVKSNYKRKLPHSLSPEKLKGPLMGNVEYIQEIKKRYIAQGSQSKNTPVVSTNPLPSPRKPLSKGKKSSKKVVESQQILSHQTSTDGTEPSTPLTEYAQYLGLQPTVRFKCYKCGESSFPSMIKLQEHQNSCLKNSKKQSFTKPLPSPPVEPTPSKNFRITRKVYLCSACGTYYENWNLFLHMREVHNRHICLHCLGMFSQADKLSEHLSSKHNERERDINTPQQFMTVFKNGCYLMCDTCEQMFTEKDTFYDHACLDLTALAMADDRACSLCGLRGSHFPTCRRAYIEMICSPPQINATRIVSLSNSSIVPLHAELGVQDKAISIAKYLIPVEKLVQGFSGETICIGPRAYFPHGEILEETQDRSRDLSDLDSEYDISDAATFCHVDIEESPDKDSPVEIYEPPDIQEPINIYETPDIQPPINIYGPPALQRYVNIYEPHEIQQPISIYEHSQMPQLVNIREPLVKQRRVTVCEPLVKKQPIYTREKQQSANVPEEMRLTDVLEKQRPAVVPEIVRPAFILEKQQPSDVLEDEQPTDIPQKQPANVPEEEQHSDVPDGEQHPPHEQQRPSDVPVDEQQPSDIPKAEQHRLSNALENELQRPINVLEEDEQERPAGVPEGGEEELPADVPEAGEEERPAYVPKSGEQQLVDVPEEQQLRLVDIPEEDELQQPADIPEEEELQQPADVPEEDEQQRPDKVPEEEDEQRWPADVPEGEEEEPRPARVPEKEKQHPADIPGGEEKQKSTDIPSGEENLQPADVPVGEEKQQPADVPEGDEEQQKLANVVECLGEQKPVDDSNMKTCAESKSIGVNEQDGNTFVSQPNDGSNSINPVVIEDDYGEERGQPTTSPEKLTKDGTNSSEDEVIRSTKVAGIPDPVNCEVLAPVTQDLIDMTEKKSEYEVPSDVDDLHEEPSESPVLRTVDLEDSGRTSTEICSMTEDIINPGVSPKADDNVHMKAQSASDADSESESSDSGDESHGSNGSSSSSDASSIENEQKYVITEESDGDNADSDKVSLVVDENRSEEDESTKGRCTDDTRNHVLEENQLINNEVEEHDEPESDSHLQENIGNDFEENKLGAVDNEHVEDPSDNIQIAGDDVPILELTLEEDMDMLQIPMLVKECVKVSCSTCVYCNHAKKIAVNGKQLVLHLLAEHRFEPVVCSDSGELTAVEGFVERLKTALSVLQDLYFNTDSYDSSDKILSRPYDGTYECFHCNFTTTLHKELYVHNRKMHQKTILLCIMCKSNFYSYSELLCHLCPGIYVPDSNITFRCCLCAVDGLPSAFRLMVHLRKRHHACDVCLEATGDQQKLSNHVWKHKLHHLCYRCGIAYRNKPDITKHLFWKHGTESVLCKKCLQKKWPHVYHFCIPPHAFVCEECNVSFSRAVALKVHKRLHGGELPYACEDCDDRFISRRLLLKHNRKHKQTFIVKQQNDQVTSKDIINGETELDDERGNFGMKNMSPEMNTTNVDLTEDIPLNDADGSNTSGEALIMAADGKNDEAVAETVSTEAMSTSEERSSEAKKAKVVDVYDLPPLNLSSDSDDSDGETSKTVPCNKEEQNVSGGEQSHDDQHVTLDLAAKTVEEISSIDEEIQPAQVLDGVWDDFKTYRAKLEQRGSLQAESTESLPFKSSTSVSSPCFADSVVVMIDHDYCARIPKQNDDADTQKQESEGVTPLTGAFLQLESDEVREEIKERLDEDDDVNTCFDVDHNYCFNTSPHNEEKDSTPSAIPTPSKKKQKSPKKKQKHSGSSSSSDSSSNSDSSSCSCGTNCSCSSSSSSSSESSSSQSTDSDSSSSEGRRRQAARRERRKERAKKKLETSPPSVENQQPPPPPITPSSLPPPRTSLSPPMSSPAPSISPPPEIPINGILDQEDQVINAVGEEEEIDLPIKESDLDTDETETDEDFYDKFPQKQANRILAEKRNQLLLLAAVAPVNNGTIVQPVQPAVPEEKEPTIKKKVKSKKHKKSQHQHSSTDKRVENKLKLNIPSSYYSSQTTFSIINPARSISPLNHTGNPPNSGPPPQLSRIPQEVFSTPNSEPSASYHSTGSGSETDSKRLSKRKRVPKKFYGDSSDEDTDQTPVQPYKWRKVVPGSGSSPHAAAQTVTSSGGFAFKSSSVSTVESVRVPSLPDQDKSEDEEGGGDSDSEREVKRSSSDSSNSDSDGEKEQDEELSDGDSDTEAAPIAQITAVASCSSDAGQQKNENLYCYCQCPYDEVSEMIACDGKDCTIEWFHFECVGIMVPPKGKWFCPDCRKRSAGRGEYLDNS